MSAHGTLTPTLKPLLGRCWMSLGALAAKAADAAARASLDRAASLFRSLGMAPFEAEARRLLESTR